MRDDLARRIAAIPDDAGNPIPTAVYKPEELYGEPQGVAPDLIVVFGDLLWRSVGTIGGDEGVQTLENDTGPDDANHAQDGLYIVAGPGVEARGRADAHLLDIAPDGARDPRDRGAGRDARPEPAPAARGSLTPRDWAAWAAAGRDRRRCSSGGKCGGSSSTAWRGQA